MGKGLWLESGIVCGVVVTIDAECVCCTVLLLIWVDSGVCVCIRFAVEAKEHRLEVGHASLLREQKYVCVWILCSALRSLKAGVWTLKFLLQGDALYFGDPRVKRHYKKICSVFGLNFFFCQKSTQYLVFYFVAHLATRTRLGMSGDGALAAFVGAFYEVVAPKVKQVSVAIEVWHLRLFIVTSVRTSQSGMRELISVVQRTEVPILRPPLLGLNTSICMVYVLNCCYVLQQGSVVTLAAMYKRLARFRARARRCGG